MVVRDDFEYPSTTEPAQRLGHWVGLTLLSRIEGLANVTPHCAREAPQLSALLDKGAPGVAPGPARRFTKSLAVRGLRLLAMNAREEARRAGLVTCDFFCGITQTGLLTESGVATLLVNLPPGLTELMTHPGYAGEDLRRTPTRLQDSRQAELAILTAPGIRNLVASQGIRLLHYGLTVG